MHLLVVAARGILRNSSSSMFLHSAAALGRPRAAAPPRPAALVLLKLLLGKANVWTFYTLQKKCIVSGRKDCSYPDRNLEKRKGTDG